MIGTWRPLIRFPSRSIGELPGNGSLPVIRWYIEQPEAVQIAAPVNLSAACLLRRHVVDGPDGDAVGRGECRRAVGLHEHAQTQVEHLDLAIFGQKDVRRLDVAVDDPLLVSVRQPEGRLKRIFDHLERAESASS